MSNKVSENRLIGYARISSHDQNLRLQRDALIAAGCREDDIFTDEASGVKSDRPGLDQAFSELQAGDTLVVWRLDRLGRSIAHLIELVGALQERNVAFRSLEDPIDTSTASGELIFHVFSAIAQFERRLIQERTMAGLAAGRARGKKGGRPKVGKNDRRVLAAKTLDKNGTEIDEICEVLDISRATFYRYLKIE